MPPTLKSSGTTAALTPGAAFTSLANTTGLSNGEMLVAWASAENLAANQALVIEVKLAPVVGGALQNIGGSPMTVLAGTAGQTLPIDAPSGASYSIAVGVIGGSATPTVPWRISQWDR